MSGASDITLGTIGSTAGVPNLNVADIPANIRSGDSKAMQAYSEGLAFENVLVNELSQQLANTMYGGTGPNGVASSDGTGGTDGSDGSSSGGLLSGASAYASLIPQTLTSSIMDGGGLGVAEQFAQEFDPSLLSQGAGAAGAGGASAGATASSKEVKS